MRSNWNVLEQGLGTCIGAPKAYNDEEMKKPASDCIVSLLIEGKGKSSTTEEGIHILLAIAISRDMVMSFEMPLSLPASSQMIARERQLLNITSNTFK